MSEANNYPNYDDPEADAEDLVFNLDQNSYPMDNEESQARALFNMTEPSSDMSKLTMSMVSIRWVVLGNLLKQFERRLNSLAPIPNGMRKPIYPRFLFLSNLKDFIDAQSPARKGKSREQVMTILANQLSGGYPRIGMEQITKPFQSEKEEKKHFWSRNNKGGDSGV
jgi:hypothetical protein